MSKVNVKRGKFYLAISWLIARLWWSLEMTRLTILRVKPKAIINLVAHDQSSLPPSKWVLQDNKLYCVGVHKSKAKLIIKVTPEIELN